MRRASPRWGRHRCRGSSVAHPRPCVSRARLIGRRGDAQCLCVTPVEDYSSRRLLDDGADDQTTYGLLAGRGSAADAEDGGPD